MQAPGGGIVPVILIAVLAAAPAWAAEPETGTASLVVENDLFYDRDRNYTSGVALVWVGTRGSTPGWALRVARRITWFPADAPVRHGYLVGQNMYTPRDITLADPPLDDRPYAGWLYGTVGLAVETGRQLDQLALTVGVVGRASGAEQTQAFVHRVQDEVEPQGWDTQLGNELGLLLTYQRSWRALATTGFAGLELDLSPHFGGALGNVYTYANTGLAARIGKRLALDHGPPRIQPSVPGSGLSLPTDTFAWYLFTGFEGRAVGRNLFLDGNTFQDSRSVDKEVLVGDVQWGVSMSWRGARLSYTRVLRSREFTRQSEHDEFGAVSLSLSF
jgi:hypothetical protein